MTQIESTAVIPISFYLLLLFLRKFLRSFFQKATASPTRPTRPLSFNTETVFTAGAHDGMLTLSARESEYCVAAWAFTVDMGFSVSKLILTESKEAAEFLIFAAALYDITREHTPEYKHREGNRHEPNAKVEQRRVYKERQDGMEQNYDHIGHKHDLPECIGAVPPIH